MGQSNHDLIRPYTKRVTAFHEMTDVGDIIQIESSHYNLLGRSITVDVFCYIHV